MRAIKMGALLGAGWTTKSQKIDDCWLNQDEWKRFQQINTNVFYFGNGYQVDTTQEYSNFKPKQIKNFKGKETPHIVDGAIGRYHEAFIDKNGKLYVSEAGA